MTKIAIGAIFRDEFDYIVEWLAWHQIAGFNTFYIADNGSSDGTRELLEALSDLGKIKIIYQPLAEKRVQLLAYNRIAELSISENYSILYIDADEFITHESMIDGDEYRHLQSCLSPNNVGGVCINWRMFGSSGHKSYSPEPVLERFNYCCADKEKSRNSPFKSASKIKYSTFIDCHKVDFYKGFDRVDVTSTKIEEYFSFQSNPPGPVTNGSAVYKPITGPLRINHYVIKSLQEYTEKKRKRGDAMISENHDRGEAFFWNHDFKDVFFKFPAKKLRRLKIKINQIFKLLDSSTFGNKLTGNIDNCNQFSLQGWLVDENGKSIGLKVNIFVNGIHQGFAQCGFYRPDLKEKNISTDGMSGFRYTHPAPLKPGDIVEVKVHANRYQFPQRARTVIE